MQTINAILTLFWIIFLYFLPTFIAVHRRHKNKKPIAALNIFLGWTFLGWVAALVWALTDNVRTKDWNNLPRHGQTSKGDSCDVQHDFIV